MRALGPWIPIIILGVKGGANTVSLNRHGSPPFTPKTNKWIAKAPPLLGCGVKPRVLLPFTQTPRVPLTLPPPRPTLRLHTQVEKNETRGNHS
jgi:hypothetical protein